MKDEEARKRAVVVDLAAEERLLRQRADDSDLTLEGAAAIVLGTATSEVRTVRAATSEPRTAA